MLNDNSFFFSVKKKKKNDQRSNPKFKCINNPTFIHIYIKSQKPINTLGNRTTTLLVQNVTARERAKTITHIFSFTFLKKHVQTKNKTFMFLFEKIEKKNLVFYFIALTFFKQ